MVLWSIQSVNAWKKLQTSDVLRCKRRFSDKDFLASYEWMAEQMRKHLRVLVPPDALPLWAWYQWEGERRRKPDLRSRGHLPKGERGVRIEFEINDNLVLLSDFNLWHYVLNYWYLPVSVADDEAFEAKLAERCLSFYKTKPVPDPVFDRVIRESWERIFDIQWVQEDLTSLIAEKSIQAVFWELSLESVRQVDEFTAR